MTEDIEMNTENESENENKFALLKLMKSEIKDLNRYSNTAKFICFVYIISLIVAFFAGHVLWAIIGFIVAEGVCEFLTDFIQKNIFKGRVSDKPSQEKKEMEKKYKKALKSLTKEEVLSFINELENEKEIKSDLLNANSSVFEEATTVKSKKNKKEKVEDFSITSK